MTNNLMLLALFISFMLLNVIDVLLTRIALRRGHRELNSFMRRLIEKLGLDNALIVKLLVPVPILIIPVIISWYIPIYLAVIILFVTVIILYSYVVLHNCIALSKAKNRIT